ncbi:MAG: nucleotide exchange factor GrpE [Thermodesulfobacteriota bacterium]|nr:nucleotide exchange factor GrpE [Thermodesulfobacteriota bacterium]
MDKEKATDTITNEHDEKDINIDSLSENEPLASEVSQEERAKKEDPEETIQRLTEEVALLNDKYLRAYAEMDNMRKRMERERGDIVKYGKSSLLKDFLVVYDSIEKGILMGRESHSKKKDFIQGLEMMEKLFLEVLKRHSVEPIETKGVVFDPHYHEAMLQVDTGDMKSGMVMEEFEKGFKIHDRILRPAKVSVSRRLEKKDKEEE